jgi:hypothetical protein
LNGALAGQLEHENISRFQILPGGLMAAGLFSFLGNCFGCL